MPDRAVSHCTFLLMLEEIGDHVQIGNTTSLTGMSVHGGEEMAEDSVTAGASRGAPARHDARLSRTRLVLAFLVAAVSDVVSYGTVLVPPVRMDSGSPDVYTTFYTIGVAVADPPGLVAEALPGVAVFPVWLLVVASVALWGESSAPARSPGLERAWCTGRPIGSGCGLARSLARAPRPGLRWCSAGCSVSWGCFWDWCCRTLPPTWRA